TGAAPAVLRSRRLSARPRRANGVIQRSMSFPRMTALPISVCRVDTPEGARDYVTCLPHEQAFANGIPPEAIIGELLRPLKPREAITAAVFARNRVFVDFL